MIAADTLVALLERWGIDHVVGVSREEMEAYYASLVDSDVRHVLARSEVSAALMVDGYARTGGGSASATASVAPGRRSSPSGWRRPPVPRAPWSLTARHHRGRPYAVPAHTLTT